VFRVVPMMLLQAVVLAQDERAVLKGLGQLGAVHLTHTHPGPDTAPLAPIDQTAELGRYNRIRSRVQELCQSLEITPQMRNKMKYSLKKDLLSSQGEREREAITTLPGEGATQAPLIDEMLQSLEQKSGDLMRYRQRILQRQKELTAICDRVSCYRGLDIPLDGLDQFSFLHFVTGSLPAQNLERLGKEISDNVVLLPLVRQKRQQLLFAITTLQDWPVLEKTLQQAGFQRELLPVVEGETVDRVSEEGEKEQEQLAAELEQLNDRLKTIANEFALPLAQIERSADAECQLLSAIQRFPRTEAAVFINGWIPAGEVATLENHMGEITGGRYALKTTLPDASSGEQVPVLLKHSRLLCPFEMLISTYGLPDYQEVEPTLFVALSYILMFGMMFGDAGHGIVLAVCGLGALLSGRSKRMKDLGVLLLFGGLSSIIFGVVYGSYFGIGAMKKYALWHDPLEGNPIQLMYGAIGIGVAMISLGLILNIINRFRRGDVIGGVLDKFGLVGLLFYWGTLVLLMHGGTIQSWGLMSTSVILFLVVPIVGWSLKEPLELFLSHGTGDRKKADDGLANAIMESCVGAFEAILSYLANTISFVRLAAYAMSHAALLFAAFMVSAEVRDFPIGGGLLSILVIIFGNIIAIVLEGIIASVQALRLEYYEFFSKFFSGNGQPFEPFRLVTDVKDSAS
jgi:V/A-type H+/Na+-transporting ATPase subunit I